MSERLPETLVTTTRDEARKQRELDEARKSGLIPAQKDEEGRDINPHIPQYIAKAPWYLNNEGPSLKHQRRSDYVPEQRSVNQWYRRGVIEESLDTKRRKTYRKGACENCGAMTHKTRDCLERPRAKGARWTNSEIAPDEFIPQEVIEDFEAKRDRWGGFQSEAYELVVEEYNAAEAAEKERKLKAAAKRRAMEREDRAAEEDDDPGDDSRIKDFDIANAPVGTKDDRTRTTTRNLRIREDTAKYLINLDLDSAFYDPKTRSMREDPTKGLPNEVREKIAYRGDNAIRDTGGSITAKQYEAFAWEAYKRGVDVHQQAHPTELELTYKEHKKKKVQLLSERQKKLIETYGGQGLQTAEDDLREASKVD
eukprot:Blabericola_migrator_1__1406@NODE_1366_length_4708_cov_65_556561_g508_i2_p2_GENE_NODE_1366_length_4708_cov_65_556561_g508_i2NODE_1366_length_4708_cov_65_556561_g508_i2_p2_ORF_typecomplete_len367_score91_54Slu7/PF11708_8/3_9e61zfCCHC_4/PF14392_6/0_066Viral_NABP/PF05515_11/0_37Viral_NABP/PF05515_11/5_7e02_NODE_1366_length_4708_cov_65_556561_g508_i234014501